jgi:hypothetical protein
MNGASAEPAAKMNRRPKITMITTIGISQKRFRFHKKLINSPKMPNLDMVFLSMPMVISSNP